jgi:hypothetical protein
MQLSDQSLKIEASPFAARSDVVIARICACEGCIRYEAGDLPASLAFLHTSSRSKTRKPLLFFIPKCLEKHGYTVAQLKEIEAQLVCLGLDLYPLDQNALH